MCLWALENAMKRAAPEAVNKALAEIDEHMSTVTRTMEDLVDRVTDYLSSQGMQEPGHTAPAELTAKVFSPAGARYLYLVEKLDQAESMIGALTAAGMALPGQTPPAPTSLRRQVEHLSHRIISDAGRLRYRITSDLIARVRQERSQRAALEAMAEERRAREKGRATAKAGADAIAAEAAEAQKNAAGKVTALASLQPMSTDMPPGLDPEADDLSEGDGDGDDVSKDDPVSFADDAMAQLRAEGLDDLIGAEGDGDADGEDGDSVSDAEEAPATVKLRAAAG